MIDKDTYELMRSKYGCVGSWAVWDPAGDTPKSNTSGMQWVSDPNLLSILDTGFVFVGLNWSSTHGDQTIGGSVDWGNFHSGYSYQHDYKLRYALSNTRYWGSYITDFIKLYAEVDSSKVKAYLSQSPDVITENIITFETEVGHLQPNPVLVAMGGETYRLLQKNLGYKYRIVKIRHYSSYISKEAYRAEILKTLEALVDSIL